MATITDADRAQIRADVADALTRDDMTAEQIADMAIDATIRATTLPAGVRAVPVGAGLAGYPERVADLVAKGRGYGQTGGTL